MAAALAAATAAVAAAAMPRCVCGVVEKAGCWARVCGGLMSCPPADSELPAQLVSHLPRRRCLPAVCGDDVWRRGTAGWRWRRLRGRDPGGCGVWRE